jgi:hypothetical protein
LIQPVVRGVIDAAAPELVFITRIDRWFDAKWVGFTGKVLGLCGHWRRSVDRCTLPPFVGNRVVSESCFERAASGSYGSREHPPLHVRQWAENNQRRSIRRVIGRPCTLVWFSGATAETGHGSLMVYDWTPEEWRAWHVTYRRDARWRILRTHGTSREELEGLSQSSVPASGS